MKLFRIRTVLPLLAFLVLLSSCFTSRKSGCSSNGKNVGAERILSGEKKLPKAKKFKA